MSGIQKQFSLTRAALSPRGHTKSQIPRSASIRLGHYSIGRCSEPACAAGFTLIELLVVITITAMVSGNVLMLSWPSDHTGWRL